MALYESVLGMIGNTPLVEISVLSPNPGAHVHQAGGAEPRRVGQGPGGPVADRAGRGDGILVPGKPGQILMEPSSGNTGIGLAMVCRVKGYHLKVVMPTNVSIERRQLLELWGAEIIESPGSEGSNGAVRMAQKPGRRPSRVGLPVPVRQPGQSQAHYEGTGPEICGTALM
jgi:cysteine synthase